MYDQIIAAKAFTAFDGIAIHGIEYGIEDHVIFSHEYNGQRDGKPHRGKIYYNASGEPFFMYNRRREYFKDYIRV